MPFWRRKQKLEEIDEAKAYERSYGEPSADVRRVQLPPRRPRDRDVLAHGESLRRAFLDRLQQREDESGAAPHGEQQGKPRES